MYWLTEVEDKIGDVSTRVLPKNYSLCLQALVSAELAKELLQVGGPELPMRIRPYRNARAKTIIDPYWPAPCHTIPE